MNRKVEQMASALDRAIREVISRGEFQDPRISGLITVTNVRVTGDMARAIVGISVLPAERQSLTVHGLNDAAAYIRREVGELIRTRTMPVLEFRADDSIKKEMEVLKALDKAKAQRTEEGTQP